MLLIKLECNSKIALFKQIYEQIKSMIEGAVLKPGDRLPSSRRLADQLGVNRTTITKAYDELWAMGYTESRSGSYSIVRERAPIVDEKKYSSGQFIDWQGNARNELADLMSIATPHPIIKANGGIINFVPLSPDPKLLPVDEFRKCINQALKRHGSDLLQYGDILGYPPLRQFISQRMRRHGMSVSPEDILMTFGIQNGIELLLKMLVRPGTKIVVESPTYAIILPLLRFYQAEVVAVDQTGEGMDLDQLENILESQRPAFIYTVPNFHNPTGITTSQAHRERLLRLSETHRVPIVEDGFEEEMKYFGKTVLPIKSMDQHQTVVYLGSFSKVLFSGLRVAWIAADKECIQMLAALKRVGYLSGNIMDQAALNQFCRYGYYDLHIKRLHKVYRKRMQVALKAAREFVPEAMAVFTKPLGGYCMWFEVKQFRGNEAEMIKKLESHGVLVTQGSSFFPFPTEKKCFRVSIAHRNETEIEEGMKRIGQALIK